MSSSDFIVEPTGPGGSSEPALMTPVHDATSVMPSRAAMIHPAFDAKVRMSVLRNSRRGASYTTALFSHRLHQTLGVKDVVPFRRYSTGDA
jgi:hypothetical protein